MADIANLDDLLALFDHVTYIRPISIYQGGPRREFDEIYRRLRTPFYEEVRYRLQQADDDELEDLRPADLYRPRFRETPIAFPLQLAMASCIMTAAPGASERSPSPDGTSNQTLPTCSHSET
ncbi:MAG: hypothetical protein H0T51_08560 [Pirellulales bacterium]|nr:hypothetical protein [Pirellulales bacterium]